MSRRPAHPTCTRPDPVARDRSRPSNPRCRPRLVRATGWIGHCTESSSAATMSYPAVQDMAWLQAANGSEATLSCQAGAPVEEPLAGWRLEALADRSKRPKSSPWQVPAEVEALVCELRRHPTGAAARDDGSRHRQRMELRALRCDHGFGRPGKQTRAFDGCDVLTRRSGLASPKPNAVRPCERRSS